MATASPGFVFCGVSWRDYEAMLRIVGDRRIRVTYDRGEMEIFLPSFGHHNDAFHLGRIVDIVTEELGEDVVGGGSTTHQRKDLGKAAEPDECYWFGDKARHMRGKRQLDLTRDPAPDLVIEVDVTRTSLDRTKIFAAIGVPEVWRSTSRTLRFLHLQENGTYQPRPSSRNFPSLLAASVADFFKQGRTVDSIVWTRSFRAFVREKVAPGR
jgi:Uma2 family endonuclease